MGVVHRLESAWDDSIARLEEALGRAMSGGNRMFEGWVRAELALALLGRGALDRAEEQARTAVEFTHARHCRPDEVRAHLALAHTQLRRADGAALSRAEQALVRARELIEEIDARAFQPAVHECRAELARLRGDLPTARREIDEARRLYIEMGAALQVKRLTGEAAS
jgi:ATP/maltotriose-dependent transcriptional regulator MalT